MADRRPDNELDRWQELYDQAVPAPEPQTSMTVHERYLGGWPARSSDERDRYRELDAASRSADIEAGQ